MSEAGPSTPVNVTGLNVAPGAGASSTCSTTSAKAERDRPGAGQTRTPARAGRRGDGQSRWRISCERLEARAAYGRRISSFGPTSAARSRPSRRNSPSSNTHEVQIKILQASVGGITEADVDWRSASDAVIIGFNVVRRRERPFARRSTPACRSAATTSSTK